MVYLVELGHSTYNGTQNIIFKIFFQLYWFRVTVLLGRFYFSFINKTLWLVKSETCWITREETSNTIKTHQQLINITKNVTTIQIFIKWIRFTVVCSRNEIYDIGTKILLLQ